MRATLLQIPHIWGAGGRQPRRAQRPSFGAGVYRRLCACVGSVRWAREDGTLGIVRVWPSVRAGSFPFPYGSHSRIQTRGTFSVLLEPSPGGRHSRVSIRTCFLPVPGTQLDDFRWAPVRRGCVLRPDWRSVGGSGVGPFQARRGGFPHGAPRTGLSPQDGAHARGYPSGLLNDCAPWRAAPAHPGRGAACE